MFREEDDGIRVQWNSEPGWGSTRGMSGHLRAALVLHVARVLDDEYNIAPETLLAPLGMGLEECARADERIAVADFGAGADASGPSRE